MLKKQVAKLRTSNEKLQNRVKEHSKALKTAFIALEDIARTFNKRNFTDIDKGRFDFESRKLSTLREVIRGGLP